MCISKADTYKHVGGKCVHMHTHTRHPTTPSTLFSSSSLGLGEHHACPSVLALIPIWFLAFIPIGLLVASYTQLWLPNYANHRSQVIPEAQCQSVMSKVTSFWFPSLKYRKFLPNRTQISSRPKRSEVWPNEARLLCHWVCLSGTPK